jgi:hypothetical protein
MPGTTGCTERTTFLASSPALSSPVTVAAYTTLTVCLLGSRLGCEYACGPSTQRMVDEPTHLQPGGGGGGILTHPQKAEVRYLASRLLFDLPCHGFFGSLPCSIVPTNMRSTTLSPSSFNMN